jgi:nucleoid DNA-binding protein
MSDVENNKEPKSLRVGRAREEEPSFNTLDMCRLIKQHEDVKELDLTIDEIKCIVEAYSEIAYKCLLRGIKVSMPKLGWFKPKKKKGMSARKMSRPLHPFTDNKEYVMVEYPKQPDYYVIDFSVRPKVAKAFRKSTTVGE